MFQFADPIFVKDRQSTLLREAANERLARSGQRSGTRARRLSFGGRVGPILTNRLGRLLPAGR